MAKVKVPRKSTTVDMTAMTDVAFLLLTFFMLATKFKPDEPVIVDTPSSVSEIKLPESDIMLLTIDKRGRVFFGIDGQQTREALIQRMAERYKMTFTPQEVKEFSLQSSFGIPIAQMSQFLKMTNEEKGKADFSGIPIDSLNNELGDWIWQARLSNNNFRVAIKGDRDADMPTVKRVIAILQEKKVNRFNFITSLEKAN
ncbi:MAG: biopolymer transporter ExbD [Bacteroidia bacterium]|nr:biopolymer transporter ExbD [Bacteroidia bacterium]MCC7532730.1 biopolymer transporter ExbD [Bacteroidia bacterium]MCZ2140114.1 biopolymer transporter ExbD [Bacteroidia bacterium]